MAFRDAGKLTASVMLIVVGTLFLLQNFGIIKDDMMKFWPLIPIALGLVLLFEYVFERKGKNNTVADWL